MSKTKNDIAWEKLFHECKILDCIKRSGYFEITSSKINEVREARLMTKFDYKHNLPEIFAEHKLAILPITRGSYLIAPFDAYHNFEKTNNNITNLLFPDHIQSIDYENISSESTALNCTYVSGILANFLDEQTLLPTVSGRMSSKKFTFNVRNVITRNSIPVNVANSQIEIDGGYEGSGSLTLIEAKNSISDDFLIRQLYYPYRLWESTLAKKIRSVFMIYSNSVFSFYEYKFQNVHDYNSLVLVNQRNYSLEATNITMDDILHEIENIELVDEPRVPFPQANSFERVINLCELLNNAPMTSDEITSNYDFDPRQTSYYTNAGRYLGLISKGDENGDVVFLLSPEGERLFKLRYKQRQLHLVNLILRHEAFLKTLKEWQLIGQQPDPGRIVEIMQSCQIYNVQSSATFKRRSSTISGWIGWIFNLVTNAIN